MNKVILVANAGFTVINFRKELITRLCELNHEVVVVCPEACSIMNTESVRNFIEKIGATHESIELSRKGLNPLHEILLFIRLIKIFKKQRPTHILNYTIKPVIYSSIAARICGVKNIFSTITGVGYVFTSKRNYILKSLIWLQYYLALKCNKLVFFQNPDDLKLFGSLNLLRGIPTKIINGSGINVEYFCSNKYEFNFLPKFIMIARILKDKGIDEFIAAAKIVKSEFPNTSFYLMGAVDENPESYSQDDITRWVDEGIIEYIPHQNDVRPFLEKADVFVLPSYREGTPRSTLEAMSMGLPIITTDTAGCRETVTNNLNGYLVPVKDSLSLANAMKLFITRPELLMAMGTKSKEIVKLKYDVRIVNQTILDELF